MLKKKQTLNLSFATEPLNCLLLTNSKDKTPCPSHPSVVYKFVCPSCSSHW